MDRAAHVSARLRWLEHRERKRDLEAEEGALTSKIQALRDELKGLAAKAGAL